MTEANQLLNEGIKAIKSGDRDKARTLLMRAVKLDEENERAWLWLSGAVKTKEERRICLENVLTLNPDNELAQKGLTQLGFPLPAPEPAPPPNPEPDDDDDDWTTPYFDPTIVPDEVNDPHERKFQDVWAGSADLCAYCAHPVQRNQKRCHNCKRPLIGKEFVNLTRSRYLIIWVILRSIFHGLAILGVFFINFIITELSLDVKNVAPVFWLVAGGLILISIGLTTALYFRQAWAYWLSVLGLTLSIVSSFYASVEQATAPTQSNPTAAPAWLTFVCAVPYIVIQLLYIYMIFMAWGDFKKEKTWRIASVNDRLKDPLMIDKIGQTLAQRNMWAAAIVHWQRAVGRNPGNTAILRRLAGGYAHLGFYERSLDTLKAALEKAKEPQVRTQITTQITYIENQLQTQK